MTYNLIWLTGTSCDGCTIKVVGDATAGGLEALLHGRVAGLPSIRLVHSLLAFEAGEAFVENLRRAVRGDLEPYGLVVESSIPNDAMAGDGFFAGEGEEDDRPVSVGQWFRRLAPGAAFVVALGDCGVWGGPHSLFPNPTGSTGVLAHLGSGYRSTLGLPVLNLPGCALPPVLIRTLIAILQFAEGQQPAPQLDAMNRPAEAYRDVWSGALSVWKG